VYSASRVSIRYTTPRRPPQRGVDQQFYTLFLVVY
jgi:hypothetical protein